MSAGTNEGAGNDAPRDSDPARSVIDALEQLLGVSSRVLLREEEKAAPPMLDVRSPEMAKAPRHTGQYHVLGEIARGGVGVVLKGHDVDLGRDVAMKVLREEHVKNASVVQRFVEEAQIGGQLQHPGIVPVYEIGTRDDGRPFFTMKLVKGRTLAVLLLDRKERGADLAADRRPLLALFERVCQTVAYAHSRRVVHRDLKPANIMVGAFGEVLVVDWGLAKVLPRDGENVPPATTAHLSQISLIETVRNAPGSIGSDSLAGSVLGTPAYMSPEQAQGQVVRTDERSDVFALGALLCEILTGEPPYTGAHDQLVARAANAELEEAHARLESCGADPELIQLAKKCLMPAIAARPANADAVSRAVTHHLASIDERARAAQIEAAEARVHALAEGRAKRLTFALAGAMVLIAGLGGGGWIVLGQQRAARVREATAQVAAALDDAEQLLAQGDAKAALAASERTRSALAGGAHEIDPGQLDLLTRRDDDLVRRSRDAVDQQQRDRENRELFAAFDALRLPEEQQQIATDWKSVDEQYSDVFQSFGPDPTVGSEADVAVALQRRGIDRELAACLDEWAHVLRSAGEEDTAARLTRLAAAIDRDPVRIRLRQALLAGDRAELQRFASDDQLAALPPPTLNLFAVALGSSAVATNAIHALRIGQRLHPDDFALTMNLAGKLFNAPGIPNSKVESCRLYAAGLALHPESIEARTGLAMSLIEADLHDDYAADLMREAAKLRPDSSRVRFLLGFLLAKQGRDEEAANAYRETLKITTYDYYSAYYAHNNLGLILKKQGQLGAAIEQYRAALAIDPKLAFAHGNLADAYADQDHLAAACAEYAIAVRIDPNDAREHSDYGRVLLNMRNYDDAIFELTAALHINDKERSAHVNRGMCFGRKGHPEKAIIDFRAELRLSPQNGFARLQLAMALANDDLEAAIAELRIAVNLLPAEADAKKMLDEWVAAQEQNDRLLERLHAAVAADPNDAGNHVQLGIALASLTQFDAAITEYRAALAIDPNQIDAHRYFGIALSMQKQFEAALAEFRAVLPLEGVTANDHNNVALALRNLGQTDEAFTEARAAVRLAPEFARAHGTLVQLFRDQDHLGAAVGEMRIVLQLDPADTFNGNLLAWTLATCEDLTLRNAAEAVVVAKAIVVLTPSESNAWNTLGVALYRDGQFEPSADALQKSIDRGATVERPFDFLFLAMCAQQLGDPERAMDWFDQANGWMKRHPPNDPPSTIDLDYDRFRPEAVKLLGIE